MSHDYRNGSCEWSLSKVNFYTGQAYSLTLRWRSPRHGTRKGKVVQGQPLGTNAARRLALMAAVLLCHYNVEYNSYLLLFFSLSLSRLSRIV